MGGPVRPSTPGIASKVNRANRSSPAPWIREWLEITCSTSVVPDRGRPKTNTGRREGWPAPALRAKNSASKDLIRLLANRSWSAGMYSRLPRASSLLMALASRRHSPARS